MKKSIAYLPRQKQEELNFLVDLIRKRIPHAEMIILYGSYARNKYVDYDERFEFGKLQFYVSDYDILVVSSGVSDSSVGKVLDNIEAIYYKQAKDPDRQPPVQFINDDIKKLNKDLSEGRYFYTQVKEEGVILYDSGKFKLARKRKLHYDEIKKQAEEYFKEKIERADSFFTLAKCAYDYKDYRMSSFQLHQACENLYYAIRLVYTQENNKQHNLSKLSGSVKKYSEELMFVFPRDTKEEERLFALIKAAYVEGRYNPDFLVTKEDIDALVPKVEMLRDITKRICEERIKEYEEMK
jgi:HEPN domain-containing protein